MPLARVDDRGRVQLPSNLRRRMMLREGDEFLAESIGADTIVLKRLDLRAMLKDAIGDAKSIDLDELERGNRGGEQPACPPEVQGFSLITTSSLQQSSADGPRSYGKIHLSPSG